MKNSILMAGIILLSISALGWGGSALNVALNGSCYTIGNLNSTSHQPFAFNGTELNFGVNFINQTNAGVKINSSNFVLLPLDHYGLQLGSDRYSVELLNITWNPVQPTMIVNLCGPTQIQPKSAIASLAVLNGSAPGTIITVANLNSWNGNVFVISNSSGPRPNLSVTIPTLQQLPSNVPNLYQYLVTALNITATPPNLTAKVTLAYNCSFNHVRLQPFMLENGLWSSIFPFDLNKTWCTISFGVPADPVVALFSSSNDIKNLDQAYNSVHPTTTTTTLSTITTTTLPTTTTILQSVSPPPPQQSSGPNYEMLAAALIIVAVIVVASLLLFKHHKPRRGGPLMIYQPLQDPLRKR